MRELTILDVEITLTYIENGATVDTVQPITVAKRVPTSLNIVTPPSKTTYVEDLPFDSTGLTMSVTYDNGKIHATELFDYPTEVLALGQDKIELSYTENSTEVTAEQPIVVTKKVLQSISVRAPPTKTAYIEDTKFDESGMVVEGLYDNGKSYVLTSYSFDTSDLVKDAASIELSYTEDGITKTVTQPITVKAKTPVSLLIKKPPTKSTYVEQTRFDKSGMAVNALCDNGKEYQVISYTFTSGELPFGTDKIELSYTENGATVTAIQQITVVKKTPTKLNIVTPPTKTTYVEDLPFDSTGLTVSVEYDNGKTHATELFDYPVEMLALGQDKIELSYSENKTTVTVEQPIVVTKKVLQSISVRAPPTKTAYIEDAKFDESGMVVEGLYDNGKSYVLTSYSFDTSDLVKDAASIELSYTEDGITKTVTQPITVKAKTPVSLLIKKPPTRSTYVEQTRFDKSGMAVNALCDNGKEYQVTSYTFTSGELPFGTDKIELSYTENGTTITAIQQITVVKKTPTKLNIVTQPSKTTYIEDTKFNKSGLTLSVEYDNGKTFPASSFDVPDDDLIYGNTSKRVSYTENGTTVSVNVPVTVVKKTPVSISIKTPPTKTKYVEETVFDKTGMVVEGLYDNGKTYSVTAYTFTSGELPMGTSEVTITLVENGVTKTTKQPIKVVKKSPVELHLIGTPVRQIEELPFDANGLSFEATYDNGKRFPVTNVAWNKSPLAKGMTDFLFTYTENEVSVGYTASFEVTQRLPIALHITKQPNKTTYSAGQKFKNAGMVVEAEYDNGKRAVVTGYTWDDVQLYEGQTSVEIRYSEAIATASTKWIMPKIVAPNLAIYTKHNFRLVNCDACFGTRRIAIEAPCFTCNSSGETGYRGVCTVAYCEDGIINLVACSDGCYQSIGTESWQTCINDTGTQKTWKEVCDKCYGDSWIDTIKTCTSCNGSKAVTRIISCPKCGGTGNTGYEIGALVKEVTAVDETLPDNGKGKDGFWYTRLGSYDDVMASRPKPKKPAPFVKSLNLKPFSKVEKSFLNMGFSFFKFW